jgi:hypothetical protein
MGSPHVSQIHPSIRENEARHSSHTGKRDARVSSRSHRRQPAGKKMFATAPPACDSHEETRLRCDADSFATAFLTAKAYLAVRNNQ